MNPAANKPHGRSLKNFLPLLPAEIELRRRIRRGEPAIIGKTRPTEKTQGNCIRAEFLRFLALGGDEHVPVHEKGIELIGAWISGMLDLQSCEIPSNFCVTVSQFERPPNFRDSHIHGLLLLSGSQLPGLKGDRLIADGGLFLRKGFISTREVRLLGAQIGGNLECNGGLFVNKQGYALSADRAKIRGSVFLTDGFKATSTVRLIGVQIGGNLSCTSGEFTSPKGNSINAERMRVDGSFQFRDLKTPIKGINLSSCRVRQLADDETSWGEGLVLDGFTYGSLSGVASCEATKRIEWLGKQRQAHYRTRRYFKPQPWQQLILTLRNMGHQEDARQIAIAYEAHRRQFRIIDGLARQACHRLFGLFIAYGYRPLRLLYIMVGVWLFCAAMYWTAALHGVFAPGNPLIFHHPDYQHCRPDYPFPDKANEKPKFGNWYLCPELAGEYTGFSPLAYSLDLILPLVDLQQEHDWAPIIPTPKAAWHSELGQFFDSDNWKYHVTRLLIWLEILFGWVASLLLVAVVSGLTNRDKNE